MARLAFQQHSLRTADHLPADPLPLGIEQLLQPRQAFLFGFHGHIVRQRGGGRSRPGAVDEAEGMIEDRALHQVQGGLEVGFSFTRKADDEVRSETDPGPRLAERGHPLLEIRDGIAPFHHRQHPVGTALHRQMHMVGQFGHFGEGLDQGIAELGRVGSGEANAFDAVDGGHVMDQSGQIGIGAVFINSKISVHVLPQKGHLAHALGGQLRHFGNDVVQRTADLLAPGIGHHAEGAVLGTALHDGDEGRRPVGAGLGQAVEFLDLRETHVHHRPSRAP